MKQKTLFFPQKGLLYFCKSIPLIVLFTILVFKTANVRAQKTLERKWSAHPIERLEIVSSELYSITLVSENSSSISAKLTVEGETFESVVLQESEFQNTLRLETAYMPFFNPFNDKLSAHKVLALDLHLSVPSNIEIYIESTQANVIGTGHFGALNVKLENGNCTLNSYQGNAKIETKRGTIRVSATSKVKGKARSRYGRAINKLPSSGAFTVIGQSNFGDVVLIPSQ